MNTTGKGIFHSKNYSDEILESRHNLSSPTKDQASDAEDKGSYLSEATRTNMQMTGISIDREALCSANDTIIYGALDVASATVISMKHYVSNN